MAITPLPDPPSRADPANFAQRGDAFLAALPTYVAEFNALQVDVTTKQATASTAASTATTKASEAAASESSASTAASTATTKAGDAEASAAAALSSKNAAAVLESNAAGSATAAANSAATVDSQKLATDYAGPTAPAITWPYMTWADTGTNMLRRRNAGNTTWINEHRLFTELKTAAYADIIGSVVGGSILQSGTNASGSFLLLADGTQLTWGTVYVNASVAAGAAVFPVVSSPSVFVGPKRSIVEVDFYVGINGAGEAIYSSKQNYQLLAAFINTGLRISSTPSFTALGSSAAASYSLSFLEIGRWKA